MTSLAVLLCSAAYFRRFTVTRPAIGVMNGSDLVVICLAVVATPLIYLSLPVWASVLVLVPTGFGIIIVTLQPVLSRRPLAVLVAAVLVVADLTTAFSFGTDNVRFLAVNDVLILLMVVGVSNLWAQSGMRVQHVAVLAAVLMAYDFMATSRLPVMADLQERVGHVPLAPFIAWTVGGHDLSLGLGDLLVAATFLLVVRRSYSRSAARVAGVVVIGGLWLSLGLVALDIVHRIIPAMVVVAPLVALQYASLRIWRGEERTTIQYLRAEPLHGAGREVPAVKPGLVLDNVSVRGGR